MRKCKKCSEMKDLDAFAKCKHSSDGYKTSCKKCLNAYAKHLRETRPEKYKISRDKYRKSEAKREYQKRYRDENKMKSRAHYAVGDALKRGDIKKPDCCEVCGDSYCEAHHDSYAIEDRLSIKWLCKQCHADRHAVISKRASETEEV